MAQIVRENRGEGGGVTARPRRKFKRFFNALARVATWLFILTHARTHSRTRLLTHQPTHSVGPKMEVIVMGDLNDFDGDVVGTLAVSMRHVGRVGREGRHRMFTVDDTLKTII